MVVDLSVSADRLVFSSREISTLQKDLLDAAEEAATAIMARHSRLHGQGKGPDGRRKENSPNYRKRKADPGILVGSRRFRGNTPMVLSGSLTASRQVKRDRREVRMSFSGTGPDGTANPEKARRLVKMGYSLHFLNRKDIKLVMKLLNKKTGVKLDKMVKVERRRR